jgi:putative ABC transport system permease protein
MVIGVVGDARVSSLTLGQGGTVYIPITQVEWRSALFVVRSENDPSSLATAVKQRLTSVAGETVVDQMQSMEVAKDIAVWQPRFFTSLFVTFAAIALVVTAVGLYGVMSYSVAQRTHDLGVRIALGASAAGLVTMVLRGTAFLTGIGLVIGAVGAIAGGKLIEAQLFGVRTTDGMTAAIVCGIVAATAALASFLPALRATQVDPLVTLRHE